MDIAIVNLLACVFRNAVLYTYSHINCYLEIVSKLNTSFSVFFFFSLLAVTVLRELNYILLNQIYICLYWHDNWVCIYYVILDIFTLDFAACQEKTLYPSLRGTNKMHNVTTLSGNSNATVHKHGLNNNCKFRFYPVFDIQYRYNKV